MARLEHPRIVPLYDYWRDPDGAYLVMRWLRGGSLRQALERGPWHEQSTVRLLQQVPTSRTSPEAPVGRNAQKYPPHCLIR